MPHIEIGLTIRQADLVLDALREELKNINHLVTINQSSPSVIIELQSNANVIRSTMQVLKDLIYKAERKIK